MLDSMLSLLNSFPEGAVLVREGVVTEANAMARDYLPQLSPGVPLPPCIPLPEPETSGSGLFTAGASAYSYSCSGCGEDLLILFRPAPQTALTSRQLDGALRQLRELLGEVLSEAGPAAALGQALPSAAFSKSFHRLFRLTDHLEYMRQAAGEAPAFHPVTMDLAGLCRHVVRLAGPLLYEAGVSLEYRSSIEGLLIPGDPELLQKLLLGLFSNAAKAVGTGQIRLSLRCQRQRAYLTVSDSAPQPSQRHLSAMSQHGPGEGIPLPGQGAGLGLDIARHIAALHGGGLLVEMGKSSPSVTLALPTGPLDGRASVRTPAVQRDGGLDPVLMELSDVLPVRIFGLEGLD